MKVPANGKKVPSNQELIAEFQAKLPQYKYGIRAGRFVDCKKSFFIGASVIPKKDAVIVNSNFPSVGSSMFFMLFMLATGILIGLIVWLVAWKPGQDAVAKEVKEVVEQMLAAQA
ncbi:MAG: hypothetical protein EP329_06270 [Deltaproteobacteria bacterium]|nr:MAG: hypothetical protein EP329_06270 [Deltaproteobacteria bacterium]